MDPEGRHERGLARLAELGDHPGGEAFLERMGSPMADWLVDWTFGEVHTRPGPGRPRPGADHPGVSGDARRLRTPGGRSHPGAAGNRCAGE